MTEHKKEKKNDKPKKSGGANFLTIVIAIILIVFFLANADAKADFASEFEKFNQNISKVEQTTKGSERKQEAKIKKLTKEQERYLLLNKEKLYKVILIRKELFLKDVDWFLLKKEGDYPNKQDNLKGNTLIFFDYSCVSCKKLHRAINNFNQEKSNEFSNMEVAFLPILLDSEHPYSKNLLKKAIIFNALNATLTGRDLENVQESLFNNKLEFENTNLIEDWLNKQGVDIDKFNKELENPIHYSTTYLYKDLLDKQTIKDSPMIVVNGKYFVPRTVIEKYSALDIELLIGYLSALATLDKIGEIKLENQ